MYGLEIGSVQLLSRVDLRFLTAARLILEMAELHVRSKISLIGREIEGVLGVILDSLRHA